MVGKAHPGSLLTILVDNIALSLSDQNSAAGCHLQVQVDALPVSTLAELIDKMWLMRLSSPTDTAVDGRLANIAMSCRQADCMKAARGPVVRLL